MTRLVLRNLGLFDPRAGTVHARREILIEGDRVVDVSQDRLDDHDAVVLDLEGRVVLPGLIDCHVHINSEAMVPHQTRETSLTDAIAYSVARDMLLRGFTTVRDCCGADAGFRVAFERGLMLGPRLFVAVDGLSQTGGHGDHRPSGDTALPQRAGSILADGVDEVRRAVRENLRRGADHIKLMASGGIASPTDPLEGSQYTEDEIRAATGEAARAGSYVAAHAYSDDAVSRAVACGVRTIEHGSLITDHAARLMAEAGAILVPTLSPYHWTTTKGVELGLAEHHIRKAQMTVDQSKTALALAQRHEVKIAFGTDLFRTPKEHQAQEFLLRADILAPVEILRSATLVGAEVVGMAGRLGEVVPGALADLIVVDGNPVEDLGLLQEQGSHIPAIVKGGEFVKLELARAPEALRSARTTPSHPHTR